jgi:hypothetical protein
LKEGVGFPRGSRGCLRSRSWEQNLDQRDSSEAEDLSFLLTHAAVAVSLGPNFVRITCNARSPTASNSKPISVGLSTLSVCCSMVGKLELRRRKSVCFAPPKLAQTDSSRCCRSLFVCSCDRVKTLLKGHPTSVARLVNKTNHTNLSFFSFLFSFLFFFVNF